MDLRAELMAAMDGTCADERAWIPLRRGVVEAVVAQLVVMEQVQGLMQALTSDKVVVAEALYSKPVVSKPAATGTGHQRKTERSTEENAALRARAIAEIQRLARDGVALTADGFDQWRNPGVPSAKALWTQLGVGYRVLVSEAGLQCAPQGRRKTPPTLSAPAGLTNQTTNGTA